MSDVCLRVKQSNGGSRLRSEYGHERHHTQDDCGAWRDVELHESSRGTPSIMSYEMNHFVRHGALAINSVPDQSVAAFYLPVARLPTAVASAWTFAASLEASASPCS